jgi:UDP-N-acetylmuramyl pentapeptide phosphotransferase/UDP-N-acetylglucosamine-1-phosphate transferase
MWQDIGNFCVKHCSILIYPPAAIMISAVLTWICIRVMPRLGMLDIPRGRHAHAKPTPLGGGIAIVISFLIVSFAFAVEHRSQPELLTLIGKFTIPAVVIAITGLLDDRYELSSWVKLMAQIAVGVMIYYLDGGFYSVFGFSLPVYVGLPLTVCWVIGVINAFNLIDGLDGLAAGLACVSSVILAIWGMLLSRGSGYPTITMIFCGACLGFLFFNFSPAKIFMGDTGSMFLGLFFAFLCSRYTSRAVTVSALLVPLLAIGVPIFDVFLAIWRRVVRRISNPGSAGIMSGDHDHLHHRVMKRTGSQRMTALLLYTLMAGIGVASLGGVLLKGIFSGAIYIVLLIGIFLAIRLADIEMLDSFGCVVKGLQRPSRRLLLVIAHPLIDYVMISLAYVVVYYIFFDQEPEFPGTYGYLLFCVPLMLILYASGIYRTYWLRAGINRYYKLCKILFTGGIFEFALIYGMNNYCSCFFNVPSAEYLYGGYVLFFLLVLVLVAGERFFMRYLESFGLRSLYIRVKVSDISDIPRLVLVGGGVACRLFIQNLYCRNYLQKPLKLCGLVDDDPALRHLNVYGLPVLGGTDDLEELYEKSPFDLLIITTSVSEEARWRIEDFARRHPVEIGIFRVDTHMCLPDDLPQALAGLSETRSTDSVNA